MRLERSRIGERPGQDVLQASVDGLHLTDPLDIAGEPGPGVVRLERLFRGTSVLGEPMLEAGGDQVVAPWKPAVERRDPDAGAVGDGLQ